MKEGLVACILVLSAAFASGEYMALSECNDAYTYLNGRYVSLAAEYNTTLEVLDNCRQDRADYMDAANNYTSLVDRLDDCEDDLKDLQQDYDKCADNVTSLGAAKTTCDASSVITDQIKAEKDRLIQQATQTKDECLAREKSLQDNLNGISDAHRADLDKLTEKINYLNEQVLTKENEVAAANRKVADLVYRLNMSVTEGYAECNKFMVNRFYPQWEQLWDDEKACLHKIIKAEKVSIMLMDKQTNIFTICSLTTLDDAVQFLQDYERLGFIEKDPSQSMAIDTDFLTNTRDAKNVQFMAGVYKPTKFTAGCITDFEDRDAIALDNRGKGTLYGTGISYLTAFGMVVVYAAAEWYFRHG